MLERWKAASLAAGILLAWVSIHWMTLGVSVAAGLIVPIAAAAALPYKSKGAWNDGCSAIALGAGIYLLLILFGHSL